MQSPMDTRRAVEASAEARKYVGAQALVFFKLDKERLPKNTRERDVWDVSHCLKHHAFRDTTRWLSKRKNIWANIPFNNGKVLTSFCRQRLYVPIKHKGWNSHVEPHFRRQATFFIETSHSQLKWLWLFFFSILGRLWLRLPTSSG